jgi:hypothetical protein
MDTMEIAVYVILAVVAFAFGIARRVFLGGSIFVMVAVVLAGIKLAGIADISWWWVALPMWTVAGAAFLKMWVAARNPERRSPRAP